jgi:hypothetical protein
MWLSTAAAAGLYSSCVDCWWAELPANTHAALVPLCSKLLKVCSTTQKQTALRTRRGNFGLLG